MNVFAVVIALVSSVIGSFGAIYLKKGSAKYNISVSGFFMNPNFVFGGFLYLVSIFVFIFALRYEKVSILYPVIAMAYIWISLLSVFILKEKMNVWKWAGILLIIIGITFIGLS